MKTHYEFVKNGKRYAACGKNRFEARDAAELMFSVDLSGARFEEIYGTQIVRAGIVR